MLKKIIILLIVFQLSACATITFKGQNEPTRVDDPHETRWANIFLIWFGKDIVNTECPEGQEVVQTQTRLNAANYFVAFFTLGIYTPRTVKHWCG